jgi:hypothetical protein
VSKTFRSSPQLPADGTSWSAARRHGRGTVRALVLAVAVVLPLVASGTALATVGHGFAGQFGGAGVADGLFSPTPVGVGVGSSGDVFASDQGYSGAGVSSPRVERFDAAGAFQSAFVVDPAAYSTLGAVAVDSAGAGGRYVTALTLSTGAPVVLKYSEAGVFDYALDASSSGTTINSGAAVAVDPSNGTVYATATDSMGLQVIDSFDQATGAFIASVDGSPGSPDGGFVCPTGLAVDGSHRLYVLDPCKGRVDRYSAAGVFVATVDGGSQGAPAAVAVDPSSGEVFVAESGPSGLQVTHFTVGGVAPVQTFAAANVGSLAAMAVGPDSTVYMADNANSMVERFTAYEGPTVTTATASDLAPRSATLNGTIDPGGVAATYRYEYGLDTSYGSSTDDLDAGGGTGADPAPGPVTGLSPNTTYHYRIVGSNSSGSILGDDQTLTTVAAPPVIGGLPAFASAITPTSARIHGTVNPGHTPSTFHIDYGITTAYGSTFPQPDGEAGSTTADTAVAATLTGLAPSTLYHFRVTADNGVGGLQHGADGTFVTAPATAATGSDLTTARATLTGTINPHGAATTYRFNYGSSAAYGSSTPEVDGGASDGEKTVSQQITGLAPSTTYHVEVVATTGALTRAGADGTFTTPPAPIATIAPATAVTTSTATLAGTADTHGLVGSYRFELSSINSSYTTSTSEQPVEGGAGAQPVTVSVSGLPAGETFRVQLVVTSDDATDYSDQITFATAPAPPVTPPAPAAVYGCAAPTINAYDARPKPGDTIKITGSDLGAGGIVVLGSTPVTPSDWSPEGFSFHIPSAATATLPLMINCGHVSNTIAIATYQVPDNRFAITKSVVKGAAARLTLKLPGVGKVQISGSRITAGTMTITKAGAVTIKVKLSAAGASALKKAKSRRLLATVRIRYTPAGGTPSTQTSELTFKRKAGH